MCADTISDKRIVTRQTSIVHRYFWHDCKGDYGDLGLLYAGKKPIQCTKLRTDVRHSFPISIFLSYTQRVYKKIEKTERLSHEVADHIVMLIQEGQLKSGDQLPSEQELTQLFGLSRPTIREAIRSLVSRNVLNVVHGRGTFVADNPGISSDPLGLDFLSKDTLYESLIEARLAIEPGVARLAAEKAEKDDLVRIETHLLDMEHTVHEHKVSMSIELEFHRSIAAASKNDLIMRIIPIIMDSIIRTYRDAQRTSQDHAVALEEHRAVFDAIDRRDPAAAEEAMRTHLQRSLARSRTKMGAGISHADSVDDGSTGPG